jgi:hypothetical protein
MNICPLCKLKHEKDHILIDYELKNYSCNIHGEKYISYCETCNKNLCEICEIEHKNHNYNSLTKLITNKENNTNELRIKIDNLKKEVNDIKNDNKFNKFQSKKYILKNSLEKNINKRIKKLENVALYINDHKRKPHVYSQPNSKRFNTNINYRFT